MLRREDSTAIGRPLFEAILGLVPLPAMEAVALRYSPDHNSRTVEVFLTQRAAGETYEGHWHCPGSFFRFGEEPRDALARLCKNEFGAQARMARFVGEPYFWDEPRGWDCSLIYLVELASDPTDASSPDPGTNSAAQNRGWFPVTRLPTPMVESHANHIIPTAVVAFHRIHLIIE